MLEIGGPSGVHEEEEVFTDIPVDTEQLIGYAPVAPVQSESEPVVGGVTRSDNPDSDEELMSTDDPAWSFESVGIEAIPEEGSPVYHPFEDEAFEGYADPVPDQNQSSIIEQQNARIFQLEAENQVHQDMEDQYKAEAYSLQFEVIELKAKVQQLEQAAPRLGPTVQQLMIQNHQLRQTIERADAREAVHHATRMVLEIERAERTQVEESGMRAATRVEALEYAMARAFRRVRSGVRRFPREGSISRRMIRRHEVYSIVRREYRRAIRRVVRRSRR